MELIIMLKMSLIICTKNRIDDMRRLFETIDIQSSIPEEIIIVDSSNNTDTENFIKGIKNNFESDIRYFHTEPGLTYQRNYGINQATGDVIFFTDDDGLFDKDYFLELIKCYDDESVGGVGPRITNCVMKSRISSFLRDMFLFSRANGDGVLQSSGFPAFQHASNMDRIKETEIIGGFCSYRKKVFEKFRFDENLRGYAFMEDVDFSYRVSREFKLLYNPFSMVYHNESTTDRIDQRRYFRMIINNHYYLTRKNDGISIKNIIPIMWAYTGLFIRATVISVNSREVQPLYGFFEGITMIMRNTFKRND